MNYQLVKNQTLYRICLIFCFVNKLSLLPKGEPWQVSFPDLFGDPKGVIDVNKDMTHEVVHEGIEYAKKHSIFERLKGYDGNMVKTLI